MADAEQSAHIVDARLVARADRAVEPMHSQVYFAPECHQAYADLGFAELQVQLRPNSPAGVSAFAPVIEAIRRG